MPTGKKPPKYICMCFEQRSKSAQNFLEQEEEREKLATSHFFLY